MNIDGVEFTDVSKVQAVDIKPDDVIVVTCNQLLTPKAIEAIKEGIEKLWSGNRVLMLHGGLNLSIVRSVGKSEVMT